MGTLSRALAQEREGEYREAAKTLLDTMDDVEESAEMPVIAEWIGSCLERVGEPEDAGSWYETAAQLALAVNTSPGPRRVSEALHFLEKAVDSYRAGGNVKAVERVKVVAHAIAKSCPST